MIPFNKPYLTGRELIYIAEAAAKGQLAGDGEFTRRCQIWLEEQLGTKKALLTHSCTAALEMAAMLAGIGPGDEVILPSYTFVSTANAFVLRGGVPVFVDIRPDTLNMNESLIEAAVTSRTRAIVAVHYAGVACEMDTIMAIARKHNLLVIEDAAMGLLSTYKGRALGSIGHMGCVSFHETKNVIAGEGGALLINDERFIERAEIVREKGTNRAQFLRGETGQYWWCDIGSSYLPGELTAAFLWAQLEEAREITGKRLAVWNLYHQGLEKAEAGESPLRRPVIPESCAHNAHMYYLLAPSAEKRNEILEQMRRRGVNPLFHYVPLHLSPAGRLFGRPSGELPHTENLPARLLRLPLWIGVDAEAVLKSLALAAACEQRGAKYF